MPLDINVLRYKKYFQVASELRVYKKDYKKNIKCLSGKQLLAKMSLSLWPLNTELHLNTLHTS